MLATFSDRASSMGTTNRLKVTFTDAKAFKSAWTFELQKGTITVPWKTRIAAGTHVCVEIEHSDAQLHFELLGQIASSTSDFFTGELKVHLDLSEDELSGLEALSESRYEDADKHLNSERSDGVSAVHSGSLSSGYVRAAAEEILSAATDLQLRDAVRQTKSPPALPRPGRHVIGVLQDPSSGLSHSEEVVAVPPSLPLVAQGPPPVPSTSSFRRAQKGDWHPATGNIPTLSSADVAISPSATGELRITGATEERDPIVSAAIPWWWYLAGGAICVLLGAIVGVVTWMVRTSTRVAPKPPLVHTLKAPPATVPAPTLGASAGSASAEGDPEATQPVVVSDSDDKAESVKTEVGSDDELDSGSDAHEAVSAADAETDREFEEIIRPKEKAGKRRKRSEGWKRRGEGLLIINAKDPHTTVFVNGKRRGKAPIWLPLKPGTYKVTFANDKLRRAINKNVTVVKGRKKRMSHSF